MVPFIFADTHNMIAFLSKSDTSVGFHQIVDFLNAQIIHYALMVNPTIYVSCIKQFWATASTKKVNDVVKLQALIDRKKVVSCMKRTAWNEFNCSMASAVICLTTGRKFKFSKYIFDSMVRNVDSPSKFLMYPQFLQVLINNKMDDLSSHTTKYTSPALTQKVFANMRRIGKRFSGVETLLFATMLVQPQATAEEDGEDEVHAAPTPPSPTHEPLPPLQEPITSSAQAQPALPSSPPHEQPTDTSQSSMTLLHTLMETCATLKYGDNVAIKEASAAEPTVFDDEEVTMTMAHTLIKIKAEKTRILDEQLATRKNMIVYLKNMVGYKMEHFKGSKSTQETPTTDPKEMSEEDVQNMLQIVLVFEFKVEALQRIRNVPPNGVFGNEVYGSDSEGFGMNPSSNECRLCNSDEWRSENHDDRVIIYGYGGGGDMVVRHGLKGCLDNRIIRSSPILPPMIVINQVLKPGLQSMTSGQISLELDLTYAPSTITTQQPSEGELDLLFEAIYGDYIRGQPSAIARTVLAA
nr:hypothetical protein [Tanacetum cinerariifolium]